MTDDGVRLVSPNDMMAAAKEHMLNGREPESEYDWMLIVNFLAVNVQKDCAEPAIKLMRWMYDMPLSEEQVVYIVQKQLEATDGR